MAKSTSIKYMEIPCVEFKQDKQVLYFFVSDAKKIWNVLSINRKIEDKDEGYQRTLSGSRVKSIAKYIDQGNVIPQKPFS